MNGLLPASAALSRIIISRSPLYTGIKNDVKMVKTKGCTHVNKTNISVCNMLNSYVFIYLDRFICCTEKHFQFRMLKIGILFIIAKHLFCLNMTPVFLDYGLNPSFPLEEGWQYNFAIQETTYLQFLAALTPGPWTALFGFRILAVWIRPEYGNITGFNLKGSVAILWIRWIHLLCRPKLWKGGQYECKNT
jgi:hypothetical protein